MRAELADGSAPAPLACLDVAARLTGRRWVWRAEVSERHAGAIAQRHDLPEILGRLLHARGVGVDQVGAFGP